MCLSIPSQPFSSVNPSNLFLQALWEQLGAISSEVPALPLGFHPVPGEVGWQQWPAQCRHSSSTAASALGVTESAPKTLTKSPKTPPVPGQGTGRSPLKLEQGRKKGKSTGMKSIEQNVCNTPKQTQNLF